MEDIKEFMPLERCESASLTPGVYYPRKVLHRVRKKHSRIQNQRAVTKKGGLNVEKPYSHQKFKFLSKWFVTMVEARWRWTLLNFFMAFTADWLFFGFLYWVLMKYHGDLLEHNLPTHQNATKYTPCIENIYSFTSTFLCSIEVHTTVAYGQRSITLQCPDVIFTMCIQCIVSSIFQACMVGILFAKLTRPKGRTQTMLFSKHAVVNMRDEKLCLLFRVDDMRKSRILNIKAKGYLLRYDVNSEGEQDLNQQEIEFQIEDCESFFFLWPVSVKHVIDETSPLHKISAADFLCQKIEIIVVFEGMIESTGQPVQARSSFTESEIMWGHRFVPMVQFDTTRKMYNVDFSKLSDTVHTDTPLCSACELDSVVDSITENSVSVHSLTEA